MSLIKVTINGVDVLSEYGVYVKSRDIPLPEPKTTFVDVDGANGSIDLSTVLTNGEVRFSDRDAGIVLTAIGDVNKARDDVSRLLHGKVCQIVFSDDLTHFYEGRLWVDKWAYSYSISEFQIKGKLKPFRYSINETVISESVRGSKTLVIENDSDYRLTPEINLSNIQPVTEYSFDWSGTKDASTTIGTPISGTGPEIVNLALNPSFESAGIAVEVSRNDCPNPLMSNAGTVDGWFRRAIVSSDHPVWAGDRLAVDVTSDAGGVYCSIGSQVGAVVATVTAQTPVGARPELHIYNETDNVWYTSAVLGDYSGEEQTLSGMWSVPAAKVLRIYVRLAGTLGTLTVRNVTTDKLRRVYSGSSVSPDPDLTPSWTGTVNNSPTVLSAPRPSHVLPAAFSGGQGQNYQTKNGRDGGNALRFFSFTSDPAGIPCAQEGLATTGNLYTMAMWVRASREITVHPRVRSVTSGVDATTLQPGVWTLVRTIVTAGSGGNNQTGLLLDGNSGHQYGDLIDVDDFTIVEGSHPDLMPFHGESENIVYGNDFTFHYPASDKPMTINDDMRKYFLHEGDNVNGFSVAPNETKTIEIVGAGDLTMTYREKVI